MTAPRSALVSLEDIPWYHCVCRCVRRAFLCGEDHFSGLNFDHRRGWIIERIQQLAALFAIDVAAYAVMSNHYNHYHIVVRIDREWALEWSVEEVLRRWTTLFTGPTVSDTVSFGITNGDEPSGGRRGRGAYRSLSGAIARFVLVYVYSQ